MWHRHRRASVFAACAWPSTLAACSGVCKTFPLWNNALLPILFLVSAMSTGAGIRAACVACSGMPDEFNRVGVLKKFHFCFPCHRDACWWLRSCSSRCTNSTAGCELGYERCSLGEYARRCSGSVLVIVGLVLPDGRSRRGFCSSARRSSRRAVRRTRFPRCPTSACSSAASCFVCSC